MNKIMSKDELKEKVVDYASKVFFYCVKRCNNRMDAEDLSQTILLEVINNIDKGARIENLDYYIWSICKNQYNMYLRKKYIELNDDNLTVRILFNRLYESNKVGNKTLNNSQIKVLTGMRNYMNSTNLKNNDIMLTMCI